MPSEVNKKDKYIDENAIVEVDESSVSSESLKIAHTTPADMDHSRLNTAYGTAVNNTREGTPLDSSDTRDKKNRPLRKGSSFLIKPQMSAKNVRDAINLQVDTIKESPEVIKEKIFFDSPPIAN